MPVFGIIIALDVLTGILALALLKPMRTAMRPRRVPDAEVTCAGAA